MNDRGRRLQQELLELVAVLARQHLGDRVPADPLELNLALVVEPDPESAGGWRVAGEGLAELLEQALGEAAALGASLQPSRVFCHRCETADCAHAVPTRPTEVFGGYGQTGLPSWVELGQVLLEYRHPEVDLLYQGSSRLLTLVIPGRDLKTRQLAAFGRRSKSYDVLHQVVAGWFRLRAPGRGARAGSGAGAVERLALSLQAVEHRGPAGETRLDLNVIGRTETGESALPLLVEALGERISVPLRTARDSLRGLQERCRDRELARNAELRSQVLGRVPVIMRKLARDLTAPARRRRRRTAHAEERRRQSRPVPAAVRESLRTSPDRTFFDEREGTLVVLGRRNRVHVFAPDGRLVTSLALEGSAVERRQRLGRWRRATVEEVDELRRALRKTTEG